MEQISLPNAVPDFTFRVLLEGVPFTFRMVWNMRSGWFLGCTTADGETLFSRRKAVPDWDLLIGLTDNRRPLGVLMLLDASGLHTEAGVDDINKTHFLFYFTAADVAAYA